MVKDGGRIDLLSCNIAGTEGGDALLSALENLTGTNIAASSDATGNADDGGNWILETDGVDAAALYFDADKLDDFEGLLATPVQNTDPILVTLTDTGSAATNAISLLMLHDLKAYFTDPDAGTLSFTLTDTVPVDGGDTTWIDITTDGILGQKTGTTMPTDTPAVGYNYIVEFTVEDNETPPLGISKKIIYPNLIDLLKS